MVRIVIVGAGFAGLRAYLYLRRFVPQAQILLFDKRTHFTYIPSLHLCINNNSYVKKISLPLKDVFGKSFINEEVIGIQKTRITTSSRSYAFDYLIIATGSTTNFFNNTNLQGFSYPAKTADDIKAINRQLRRAKNVTVVGGGLSGVEYAGVLATKTDKNITLITSSPHLLHTLPKKAGIIAQRFFEKRGVNLLLNQRVTSITQDTVQLESNETVESDLTIFCAGIDQSTPLIKNPELNTHLAFTTSKNIFFCGDVAKTKCSATAHNAMIEGEYVASHIARLVNKKGKIAKHENWTTLAVALGPHQGIITTKRRAFALPIVGSMKWFIERRVLFEFKRKIRLFI